MQNVLQPDGPPEDVHRKAPTMSGGQIRSKRHVQKSVTRGIKCRWEISKAHLSLQQNMACLVSRLAHEGQVEQVLCMLQEVQHPQRDGRLVAQHAFRRQSFPKWAIQGGSQRGQRVGAILCCLDCIRISCKETFWSKHQHILHLQNLS